MTDPERVRRSMRELGRRLAAFRRTAGLNQFALAAAVHYTRSTVANVEVGRQNAPLDFWLRCDETLGAGGVLRSGYDALCLMRTAAGRGQTHRAGDAGPGRTSQVDDRAAGQRAPSGPLIISGPLADRLAQLLNAHMGPGAARPSSLADVPDWDADTLGALAELGRVDVDPQRRRVLGMAAHAVAVLGLPGDRWWTRMVAFGRARACGEPSMVGVGDVAAVRDMTGFFSRVDQQRGGGHARTAVVQYLTRDVTTFLAGTFTSDQTRREMFTAAGELAYLAGWMCFDNAEHALASHWFTAAVKLAAEADNPPLAGHILRAMAHQAVDLGNPRQAVDLADASVRGTRYDAASHRERSLLGVVHARALSASGDKRAAAAALVQAENDLAAARPGDDEPDRVFFFGEASLAHETACALRDVDDLAGAVTQFERSVRTRKAAPFARTHAVTLGYLGAVHAGLGELDQACATWQAALNTMEGVRSGRTRQVAGEIRALVAPLRRRGVHTAADLDTRAARYLAATT